MLSHAKLMSLGITTPDYSERFLRFTPRRGSERILQNPRLQAAGTSFYSKFIAYFQASSEIVRSRSSREVLTAAWKFNRIQYEVAGANQQPLKHTRRTSIPSFPSGGEFEGFGVRPTIFSYGELRTSIPAFPSGGEFEGFGVKPTTFSYGELRAATCDFHEDMRLEMQGLAFLYKGVLPSGEVVAIKKLFPTNDGVNVNKRFLKEVVLTTNMNHKNVRKLKGYCHRGSDWLLVYEFVDNYNVHEVLFGSKKEEMRSRLAGWTARHKICLGIAHGLYYLHAMADPRVIHGHIKATNVVLTSDLEAKIANFRLARPFPNEESGSSDVVGSSGFTALKYFTHGKWSKKVDIYSFGVLCLEIVSGRLCIQWDAPTNQFNLTDWAWRLNKQDKLIDLVDPALEVRHEQVKDVQWFLNMCLQCISHVAEKLPSMAQIVSILQGDTK